MFKQDTSFNSNKIIKTDIIPKKAFYLSNVLTKKECQFMIDYGEKKKFQSLAREYSPNYRKSQRIIEDNKIMAKVWFDRVHKYISSIINLDGKERSLYQFPEIYGKWKLDGINPHFRLCKYAPDGFFKKHYDEGYHPVKLKHRTFLTIMVYLNDDFDDGETIFYDDQTQKEIYRLVPKVGDCLIFNQQILHEGNVVNNGLKYMVRSDIFYKKLSSDNININNINIDTKNNTEAIKLLRQSIQAGKEGNYKYATKLCNKAVKLYPDIWDNFVE